MTFDETVERLRNAGGGLVGVWVSPETGEAKYFFQNNWVSKTMCEALTRAAEQLMEAPLSETPQ